MTNSDHEQSPDNHGYPFFLVRLILPDPAAIELFEPALRELMKTKMGQVYRMFRAQTLPVPGSDDRLASSAFLSDLSSELNDIFIKDIDRASRDVISAVLASGSIEALVGVAFAGPKPETGDDIREKIRTASALLGKYWYRHREADYFVAKQYVDDLTEARARGETGKDISWPEIQPGPPRRLK